jgi:hypothetical protein
MDRLHRMTWRARAPRALRLAPLCAALLLGGAGLSLAGGGGTAAEGDTLLGEPLRETEELRVAALLKEPEQYVGQRIRIVGLVEDVCPMKGCWVEIVETQGSESIRFKVEDDVVVFPATARGQEIVAEGVLTARDLDVAGARRWLGHLAEERGEEFDPESVTEPLRLFEIQGEGAALRPAKP